MKFRRLLFYHLQIKLKSSKKCISGGVNATSQLNAIKKFIELNEIKKTIFLTPN